MLVKYYILWGFNMNDEQIKEITIAMINNKLLYMGDDNKQTAEEVAKFINSLKENLIIG